MESYSIVSQCCHQKNLKFDEEIEVRLYWSYGLIWSFEPGTGAEPI
jgi:hypothetical protein